MKNTFANAMLAVIVGAMLFPVNVFAAKAPEIPGESVYASKAEQEAIGEAITKSGHLVPFLDRNGITILSESITPVYVASLYEYAETGSFVIRPGTLRENGYYYVAKTVNAGGLFAGNLYIEVLDGVAYLSNFVPTRVLEHYFDPEFGLGSNEFVVSRSYADHARRIQNLANRKSFVPVGEVRFVWVEGLGYVFYINDGKREALVTIEGAEDVYYRQDREIIYVGRELKKIADDRVAKREAQLKKWAEQKAAWEAANPGKRWAATGDGGIMATYAVRDNVDDIINIAEYLGAAAIVDAAADTSPSTTNNLAWLWLLALPLAALAVFVGVRLIRKGKEAGNADSQSDDN